MFYSLAPSYWAVKTPADFALDQAVFLLIRGAYSYMGYTWNGCSDNCTSGPGLRVCVRSEPTPLADGAVHCPTFPCAESKQPAYKYWLPASVHRDYGVPLVPSRPCVESRPGVFTRAFTKASVELDCNTFEPRITMKP